jgi:1-acyl-sn-glycerol-3-phosphate acyltransferase
VKLPPYHWWRTVFFLIPTIALYTIVLGTLSFLVAFVDRTGNTSHKFAQWWGKAILGTTGVRVRFSGASLPTTSCIFVANHASIYDTPILLGSIPRQLRLMAKSALKWVPFIGWHLALSRHVLVDRKNPGASVFKRMQRMARLGASVFVFPEGSRSADGALKAFKPGIFLLAIENKLPLVPLTVIGSRDVMPKGRLMTCPADVEIVVHDPIVTDGLSRKDTRELAERVRAIIGSSLSAAA